MRISNPSETRTTKDFAPNLDNIAEKTDARWVCWWIKDPTNYAAHPAMPSLRLSDHEALALTSFLMTHGQKKEDPGVEVALKDPAEHPEGRSFGAQVRMLRMPRDQRHGA